MAKKRESDIKPDIIDGTRWYFFGDRDTSPWIDKTRGTGRVLTTLLKSQTRYVHLGQIEQLTGWENPGRNMDRLAMQVNACSDYYKVEPNANKTKYRLVRK